MKLAGAAWVAAFLLWLPFEDTQLWMSMTLAAVGCFWLCARILRSWKTPLVLWKTLGLGALLGAVTPLLAVTLMAFKSGLHAHGFADFTARQVWQTLAAIPYAILIGMVVSLVLYEARPRKAVT